jgi:hypothetical protein
MNDRKIERYVKEIIGLLERIERNTNPHHYTISLTLVPQQFAVSVTLLENHQMKITKINGRTVRQNSVGDIGALTSPGTATLSLELLDNGQPYVTPPGSSYVFDPTISAGGDFSVSMTANPTVPDQVDVVIEAGDGNASITFTSTAIAPDGSTATGTLTLPLSQVTPTDNFTVSINQVN